MLGDGVYGAGMKSRTRHLDDAATAALTALERQALHAQLLGFEHPATDEAMTFEASLPDDLARLLTALENTR